MTTATQLMPSEPTPKQRVALSQPAISFPRQGEWTYEHWLKFPNDGWKYEIIDGVLHMSPPPSIKHQDVSMELSARLRMYVRTHRLGKVLAAPCGVHLPNQPIPLEPDILFVRQERSAILQKNYVEGAPDLIVEVLSPSNSDYDLDTKKNQYEQAHVREYWIVNPWMETVLVYRLQDGQYGEPLLLQKQDTLISSQIEGFSVQVEQLFDLGD